MPNAFMMNYVLEGEETERLRFRLVDRNDYDAWLPLFQDGTAGRFLGMAHLSTPEAQCDLWFERVLARYENNSGGMNALIEKRTGMLVGQCGLLVQEVEGESIIEIGYSLLPDGRGRGYASEAARKCRDYAFAHGFAEALHSIIHVDNHASMAVAQRNGMRLWKTLPNFKTMPVQIFRIVKGDAG